MEKNFLASPLFAVIMGSPGAGKGTQAERLAKNYSIPHISSGALLREVTKEDTQRGRSLKETMERGELAPNDLIINIMTERLNKPDCKKGFIIDGFPRARVEAMALEDILKKQGKRLGNVIEIKISRETSLRRLLARARSDDSPDAIKNRYDIYLEETKEVIKYFNSKKNLYREINGERHIDTITKELISMIEAQFREILPDLRREEI